VRFLSRAQALLRIYPVTASVTTLLVLMAIITGNLTQGAAHLSSLDLGAGITTTLEDRRWWTILTDLFVAHDLTQFIIDLAAAIVLLGIAERLLKPARTALAFMATGLLGVGLGITLQVVGTAAGEWWASGTRTSETLDPLTPVVGVLLTASASMSTLWRRRVRVVTVATLLIFVLYSGAPSDIYRLIAAGVGVPLGWLLTRGKTRRSLEHSPRLVRRRILATVTAVTAIGPFIALTQPSGLAPFSLVSGIISGNVVSASTVLEQCGNFVHSACTKQLLLAGGYGTGSAAMAFVPIVLLLVAAWGLSRGRRFALSLAIIVNLALAVLSLIAFNVFALFSDLPEPGWSTLSLVELIGSTLLAFALPLAMAVVLFVNRSYFPVRSSGHHIRRFVIVSSLTFAVLFLVTLVMLVVGTTATNHGANPGTLLWTSLKPFVPLHLFGWVHVAHQPLFAVGLLLFHWAGPLFWLAFVVGCIYVLANARSETHVQDQRRVRDILKTGGGSLGFMATWPGNDYWFSPDGKVAIAYRVINGVALTVSDPIGAAGNELQHIQEFSSFCDRRHLRPVFYSVHEHLLPTFEMLGWQSVAVGQETLIDLEALDIASKAWQKVRHALNRAARENVTTLWTSWPELTTDQVSQIRRISEGWVSARDIPEMGFTLGTAAELEDPDVRLMLAIDGDGRIHGITSWLPNYRDGVVIGWTLDFMRRGENSVSGVMEFLIGSTALHLKEARNELMSLSGVPLARKPESPNSAPASTALMRLLDFLAKRLEPAYGFSSLMFFKAKFNPRYETLYMAYPDPVALPAIAVAVGRAYLPNVSARKTLSMLRNLAG
jgi:phosphatidylglycerol lysyltransferase